MRLGSLSVKEGEWYLCLGGVVRLGEACESAEHRAWHVDDVRMAAIERRVQHHPESGPIKPVNSKHSVESCGCSPEAQDCLMAQPFAYRLLLPCSLFLYSLSFLYLPAPPSSCVPWPYGALVPLVFLVQILRSGMGPSPAFYTTPQKLPAGPGIGCPWGMRSSWFSQM